MKYAHVKLGISLIKSVGNFANGAEPFCNLASVWQNLPYCFASLSVPGFIYAAQLGREREWGRREPIRTAAGKRVGRRMRVSSLEACREYKSGRKAPCKSNELGAAFTSLSANNRRLLSFVPKSLFYLHRASDTVRNSRGVAACIPKALPRPVVQASVDNVYDTAGI